MIRLLCLYTFASLFFNFTAQKYKYRGVKAVTFVTLL